MKKEASQEKGDKKQAGVAILMSNKIDFQQKLIKKKKKQERTLYMHQGKYPTGEFINSEHLRPKCKGTHICKRDITKAQIIHPKH